MNNPLDVLFISAPSQNVSMFYAMTKQGMPPLGLGYIATYLKRENYAVKIIDMNLNSKTVDAVLDVLRNQKPRIVGLSCTTETYNTAIRLAKIVKAECKNSLVVLGGPHVSFEYETALEHAEIDYISFNEGEISFKKLCDYTIRKIGTIEDLRGIAYKRNGTVICTPPEPFIEDLDTLPFPDRELFDDLSEYSSPATISTSRGCPGKCVFCAASVLSGGRYRLRSAKNIVSEFSYLKSLGFNHINIIDDTMTANRKRLDEILNELIASNLQMTWFCESRVDAVTRDMLIKMKAAGLTNIQFGVESGSQKILDSIKKNIKLEQILNVFDWCKEIGIGTATNMIIGQPEDDADSIKSTISLAEKIASTGALVSFSVCTPFPGTPLWENSDDFGITIVDHDLDHYSTFTPVFNTKYFNVNEIRNEYYKALKFMETRRFFRKP